MSELIDLSEESLAERLVLLGKRVRDARYSKSVSLDEVSKRAGISIGLLSQIERGLGNPSYSTLIKLAHALEIPLGTFYEGQADRDEILVRSGQRKKIVLPDRGMAFELLSPDTNRAVEFILWEVSPGLGIWDTPATHRGEETMFVVRGCLDVKIGDRLYRLGAGDSIYVGPGAAHWYGNPGDEITVCVSAVSPPSF